MISIEYSVASSLLAMAIIIIITIMGERWGTRIGGIIGTIPFLLVVGLAFISLSQNDRFAADVATVVILEMGANITLITLYLFNINRGILRALLIGVGGWGTISIGIFLTGGAGLLGNMVLYSLMLVINLKALQKIDMNSEIKKIKYTWKEILFRGFLGGITIGSAVFLSIVGGPIIGGIFSVFPVIFISTLVIYSLRHKENTIKSMGKSMTLGSLNVVSYATTAALTFPIIGMVWGTLISIIASFLSSYILIILTRKKLFKRG